jgi:hypothetical protein
VILLPHPLPLEDLASLVDLSAVYVGGDTGPLHVAAARKHLAGSDALSNRTRVVGVFKATDPRIYGYDSHRADMLPASQSARSITVESAPTCKNLSCSLQRVIASCSTAECHAQLDADAVSHAVISGLAPESVVALPIIDSARSEAPVSRLG